ncbi:hypothetical protein O6H91_05G099100 [Diphasiastrum complanatum]|uniref:Uncharacterized protein n=1 Tax=Diphasiastrum complanatum TaxID=34168 RepID=A0ACC2DR64_DIPCM|nr:hypothetical protein O6H91_05G099100 [Diphasiastrum complanatum]
MSAGAPSPKPLDAPISANASAPSVPSPISASAPVPSPAVQAPTQPSPSPSAPVAPPSTTTQPSPPPKASPPSVSPAPPPVGGITPAPAPASVLPPTSISPPPNSSPPVTSGGSVPPASQSPPPAVAAPSPLANQGTPPPVSAPPPPVSAPPPPVSAPPPHALVNPPIVAPPPLSNPPVVGPGTNAPPPPGAPPPPSLASQGSPPGVSSSGSGSNGTSTTVIVGVAVGGAVVVALIAVLILWFTRKRKKEDLSGSAPGGSYSERDGSQVGNRRRRPGSPYSSSSDAISNPLFPPPRPPPPGLKNIVYGNDFGAADAGPRKPVPPPPQGSSSLGNSRSWFTYEELELATNGFSRANLLGEGGFGYVYKGQLEGGQTVAVKQLKLGGGQGEREFQAEVEIITRIHHRHLVSLVGYCIADTQRLLVYDYVPNGTLEYHLHGKQRPVVEWATRLKIAIGAARGLAYLHEDCHPRIIHRDIKSSNILLDNNFEAQVSDFGLAKLASDAYTHVTTRVMGTFGYLAPEYASSGKLTDKSDVYSFGVVLLELITGRRPVDTSQPLGQESLVEWGRPLLSQVMEERNLEVLADPRLGAYDQKEMIRMVGAAAACVRHSAHKRPRMGQVVRALESEMELSDLNQGVKPGESAIHGSYASIDFDSAEFSIDMRGFRRLGQNNQEPSTDYSGISGSSGNSSTENPKKELEVGKGRYSTWLGRSSQKNSIDQQSSRKYDESEWPLRISPASSSVDELFQL